MPNVVTDPEIIRRVREAAGKGQATQPAPTTAPSGGRVVTDPGVIQAVKNRKRFNDAAAKKRQQILETGQAMPAAPDRIGQASHHESVERCRGIDEPDAVDGIRPASS